MLKRFEAKRNIVTEYFVQQHRLSKENDESRLIDFKEKQETISRTKAGEFEYFENERSIRPKEEAGNFLNEDSEINY